ncbi:hypothetical protein [Nocardioides lianchengensis]|uniref:WD40-like Beta Propeller Repeat n=1 Tax=Nocardioides lianchengensis TaxID=1045774 RepID=A0A1G6IJN9_9ACTN|nr:hypothetical protein [Nocardioides lianchengensis]NYG13022.1 hypothetical protein [Nocardioides lianchengensis]SDC06671.1 hypothetical protein SAMN05421872_101204 [Nocardioides lianchengensis]
MNDQTLEERLVRSLDQQAGALYDAPFTLGDVQGRARGLRRRRRAAAVGVAAAVLAVVVPTAVLVGGDDRGVDPAPEPAPTPLRGGASVLDSSGDLTAPDGSVRPVPFGPDVTEFAVLDDGRVVATTGRTVLVVDDRVPGITRYRTALNDLTTGDGRAAAWVGDDLRVQVLESGVTDPVAFPGIPMAGEAVGMVDAVLGSDCAAGGCRVLAGDGSTTQYDITLDGAEPLALPEPLRVEDVSPDGTLWSVRYPDESDPQYGCSGLYDVAAGALEARTCETTGLRFSPDGQHLLALEGDGGVYDGVTVLDLGLGSTVLRYEPRDGAVVTGAAWADADHLLVSTAGLDGAGWELTRHGISDGSSEVLAGPVPGGNPEEALEFAFSE